MDLHSLLLLCLVLTLFSPLVGIVTELISGLSELLLSYISILIAKNQVIVTKLAKDLEESSDEATDCIGFQLPNEVLSDDKEEYEDD